MRTQSSSSYFKFKCGILICWTVINFCCAFATCCRLRSAAKLALAFSFAVLSASSLSCSLDLGWLVNSCKRIKYLATRRHLVGIAKYIHAFFRVLFSEGKYIDGQSRKNSPVNITTETRAASLSCHDAHKLDNGVAGMEDLSGSKDLSKSLSTSDVMVYRLLQTKHTQRHKDGRAYLCITSKLCLNSNLRTLRSVGT